METKKILVPTIIAVVTLVIITIGATYAFFTVGQTNNFGTVSASASTGEIGGVTLTKADNSDLSLNVTATQMLEANKGTYYASGSSTPKTIATLEATGAGTYSCTYTVTVTKTATNDLYAKYQSLASKPANEVYFTINEKIYDFSTANLFTDNTVTYTKTEEGIKEGTNKYITSNIVIVNSSNDQTLLNDGDITLKYEVTSFACNLTAN